MGISSTWGRKAKLRINPVVAILASINRERKLNHSIAIRLYGIEVKQGTEAIYFGSTLEQKLHTSESYKRFEGLQFLSREEMGLHLKYTKFDILR